MKKLHMLLYALGCISFISCMRHHGDIDISYKDADSYYAMNADFSKRQTRELEHYMNQKIGSSSNITFVNTNTDAIITLNDHTKFYMLKKPGHLEIKLNKEENSKAAYHRIKSMCEGMKNVLTK